MTSGAAELYDYAALRRRRDPTMTVVQADASLVVLGSRQSLQDLRPEARAGAVRRRRGGGGVVLTQPGDVWVDWWIPADDARWRPDVRRAAVVAGHWWADALAPVLTGSVRVHEGPLDGADAHRVVCFAGRGPGEVFVDGRKAVGMTQWRVREGALVSTILPAHPSLALVDLLAQVPPGLATALDHHTRETLGLEDVAHLVRRLAEASGPWAVDVLRLTP